MSISHAARRAGGPLLLAAVFVLTTLGSATAEPEGPSRDYIVTLSVPDAGEAIRTSGRTGRQRMRRRAVRARDATARVERRHGVRARHRYTSAVAGFSARLTARQAARLRRDPDVAEVRRARRVRIASQVVPVGVKRVRGRLPGGPRPDVDVDIAVLDTGIGPVGGGELNVRGGTNCSGDGAGPDAHTDLYPGRHGTHVAGIAAARDNGVGIVGVAPGARLWSVRVFRASGYGDESTIICGLDWAVATRSATPPPGSQPIDVINMSIQGPRLVGGPEACGVAGDPDLMHVAVCAAYAAGITSVVAAGNDATNAASVAPAGYDQVITVGAMNDYDGRGGERKRATCRFLSFETDDHYASYSNWGPDIDIVAPGTCVESTLPSPDGDATQRLTGTSMSTPYVAGAVARYLAEHPGTPPETMRRILRAAGRLNWVATSDPAYAGVHAANAPHRLLDVQALMGGAHVRTWVLPSTGRLGGTRTSRDFRVDVQRYGGFAGDVTLSVNGLPASAAEATFANGPMLSGLGALGTRMTLEAPAGGSDFAGVVRVRAAASGGQPAGGRDLSLVVDRSGPIVKGPFTRILGGRRALGPDDRATVAVSWRSRDELTKVTWNELHRKGGGGGWTRVTSGRRTQRGEARIKPGTGYRFRVRATDKVGNATTAKTPIRLAIRDSSSPRMEGAASGWRTRSSADAVGGSLLASTAAAARLTTTFDGVGVAVVAPIGPGRGQLRVRIDGGAWQRVDLRASRDRARRVVFSRRLRTGAHTIEIEARSGAPAIDAIVIQR